MKVALLLFSFLFLFSAMNDCCLSEMGEELTQITESTHSEESHSNETVACEECACSTFCSYNLVTENFKTSLIDPLFYKKPHEYFLKVAKEKNIPESIFHPPIV